MNLICITWKCPKYQTLKSFHVSLSRNGILPSQFPIPGLHLHSHVSPAFFKQTSTINCPCTNLNNLNVMQHSMIQFPPHLLQPTANFIITFPKSHFPNIQQTSLSLHQWNQEPCQTKKTYSDPPTWECLLSPPTSTSHHICPCSVPHPDLQLLEFLLLCCSQRQDYVPFLNPASTPYRQQLTGQALCSESRTCTPNSTTTHTGNKTANFTNTRNYVTRYWHKSLEKGEIMETSPHWQDERKGSLPTTKDGHSSCSGKGLDLYNYNLPSLSGVIQREQGLQPQGTGRSAECRALPALYLGSDIPIPISIFQLQTRWFHRACAVGNGTLP